jgi:hypothetical protein
VPVSAFEHPHRDRHQYAPHRRQLARFTRGSVVDVDGRIHRRRLAGPVADVGAPFQPEATVSADRNSAYRIHVHGPDCRCRLSLALTVGRPNGRSHEKEEGYECIAHRSTMLEPPKSICRAGPADHVRVSPSRPPTRSLSFDINPANQHHVQIA